MNAGGLVLHAFKIIFGNVDVAVILIGFSVIFTLAFTLLGIYEKSRSEE